MISPLSGLWQLSPLTDLSIPQDDLTFPGPLSQILPSTLSEQDIAAQEWHLMHDIELDEVQLAYPAIDLVISGIDYFAEVRVNGVAVFDCDGSSREYKKDIRPYLQLGPNRFEILFLEQEEDWLIDDEPEQREPIVATDSRMGIWMQPYLQFISNLRLDQVTTEQIWHHGGGCEFLVDLQYTTYKPGLVSASVKFNSMTYHLPIDVRANHVSALFQIDAPVCIDECEPNPSDLYPLEVNLDGQHTELLIGLSPSLTVTHYRV